MKENKKKTHYLLFQVKSHMLDFTFISVCSFFFLFFLNYKLLFFWIEEIVFEAEFLLRSGYVA